MSLVKVRSKFQIVIPDDIRKRLHVQVGDTLEMQEKDGMLVIKPVIVVDKAQAYFWTDDWQAGEKDAETAKKQGDFKEFSEADEAVKWLKS
ncbi:MAG: AbrB/MazE/SpoVT family DNA-binding domain-containing protein [Nitrospirae bacterium]|nr:AbrB/MazE/SpoVT family DNA-binding domain-containing protein [Nitrospirota bacterium]